MGCSVVVVARAANNALERTVIRRRVRAASATLNYALAARMTCFYAAAQRERWIATTLAERIFSTSCGIEVEKNSPSIIVESVRGSRNGVLSLNHCVLP